MRYFVGDSVKDVREIKALAAALVLSLDDLTNPEMSFDNALTRARSEASRLAPKLALLRAVCTEEIPVPAPAGRKSDKTPTVASEPGRPHV
jgi:hypothetical protein